MTRSLLFISLSLCAICANAQSQDEARTYGYPGQPGSGPAAPSTIPGHSDSNARVPDVRPAPTVQPKPRKPNAPQSPWGGAAGTQAPNMAPMPNKPATPPAASQPPVAQNGNPAKPPVAGNGGASGATTTTTPGASAPPPSQPPAGANDRMTSLYRGLSNTSAIIRSGGAATVGVERVTSTALACARNGNTPTITRIRPANDTSLQPGAVFIVEGLCFGDEHGKVQVTLPTRYGRIQANEAKVIDWAGGKILAQLAGGIVKVLPGTAAINVTSAGGVRSEHKEAAFEPLWQLSLVPAVTARVRECLGAGAKNRCTAGDDTESDDAFEMPKSARCSGIGTCFGSDHGPAKDYGDALALHGYHYTKDDIDRPLRGRDRFELTLQPWMRPSHCSTTVTAFSTDGRQDASAVARFDTDGIVVEWALTKVGDPGWLTYRANCEVWVPVGLGAQ